jgi:hypothetical protein
MSDTSRDAAIGEQDRGKSGGKSNTMKSKDAAIRYIEQMQEIQKRNPPDSLEWIEASKEINAVARRLAAGEFDE